MASKEGEVVCGSGFIGSWLVRLLLHRGYAYASLWDERETRSTWKPWTEPIPDFASSIDLLDYGSIVAAVSGVFHLASPNTVNQVDDPQRDLLNPAIKGTTTLGAWLSLLLSLPGLQAPTIWLMQVKIAGLMRITAAKMGYFTV